MSLTIPNNGNAKSGLFMLLQAADFIENRDTDRKPGLEDHNYHAQQMHRPPHLQLKNPSHQLELVSGSSSSCSSRSSSTSRTFPTSSSNTQHQQRCTHNELEKNRRAHQRSLLGELQKRVDPGDDGVRATTLNILKRAYQEITNLHTEKRRLEMLENKFRTEGDQLIQRKREACLRLREVKQSLEEIHDKLVSAQSSSTADTTLEGSNSDQPVAKQPRMETSAASRKIKASAPGSLNGTTLMPFVSSNNRKYVYHRMYQGVSPQQGSYSVTNSKHTNGSGMPSLPGRHDRNRNGSECSIMTTSSEDSELAAVEWQMHPCSSTSQYTSSRHVSSRGEFASPDSGYDSPITVPGATTMAGSRSSPPTIVGHPLTGSGCMAPRRGDPVNTVAAIVH